MSLTAIWLNAVVLINTNKRREIFSLHATAFVPRARRISRQDPTMKIQSIVHAGLHSVGNAATMAIIARERYPWSKLTHEWNRHAIIIGSVSICRRFLCYNWCGDWIVRLCFLGVSRSVLIVGELISNSSFAAWVIWGWCRWCVCFPLAVLQIWWGTWQFGVDWKSWGSSSGLCWMILGLIGANCLGKDSWLSAVDDGAWQFLIVGIIAGMLLLLLFILVSITRSVVASFEVVLLLLVASSSSSWSRSCC